MSEPSVIAIAMPPAVTRRTIVRAGVRLAYAVPLISASYSLSVLRAGATNALSADNEVAAAADAAAKNTPPVAVPGDGFDVVDADGDGVETVTVDGSASTDPDGTIVSYLWTLDGKWISSEAVAKVTLPVGTHRLLLTVTDNQGASNAAKIRIRVKPAASSSPPDATQTPQDAAAAAPILPPAPYQVKAKQKLVEVALTWKVHPNTPTPYRIYRTIDDGQNLPVDQRDWTLQFEEPEKLSYRDANVSPTVPYLYVVRSFDGANESPYSNVAAITLDPVAQPTETEQPVQVAPTEMPTPTEVPTEVPVPTEAPTEPPVPTEAPAVEQSAADAPTDAPTTESGS